MKEIWKDVAGYEGLYKVSSIGRVRSLDRIIKGKRTIPFKGRLLLSAISGGGYPWIMLCNKGEEKYKTIHRLVSIAFILNPKNKPCVNHIDGDKTNNHIFNLEWVTHKENVQHAYKIGLRDSQHLIGENSRQSHLTKQDVLDIREKYSNGTKQYVLAREYGVTSTAILKIRKRVNWSHI